MRTHAVALAVLAIVAATEVPARCPDVALVLAIDTSGSISDTDFYLQLTGYHQALTDPRVLESLRAAGTVDLAAVLWSDSAVPRQVVGWHRLESQRDLDRFTEDLLLTPRQGTGNTDIGTGINTALDLLARFESCPTRRVIDVSGDGRATPVLRRADLVALSVARDRAFKMGVVINALAISDEDPGLAAYYARHVAGGPGAFVMEARSMDDFSEMLARKIARELLPEMADNSPLDQSGSDDG